MEKFKYLEHTADVLFQAYGSTFNELLLNATLAMCNAVCDFGSVGQKDSVKIEVSAGNREELLHNFLKEILFKIDTERMLFSNFKIELDEGKNAVKAELLGEKINPEKHTIKAEVKAVTWHNFWVKKENNKWSCQVLLDI